MCLFTLLGIGQSESEVKYLNYRNLLFLKSEAEIEFSNNYCVPNFSLNKPVRSIVYLQLWFSSSFASSWSCIFTMEIEAIWVQTCTNIFFVLPCFLKVSYLLARVIVIFFKSKYVQIILTIYKGILMNEDKVP